ARTMRNGAASSARPGSSWAIETWCWTQVGFTRLVHIKRQSRVNPRSVGIPSRDVRSESPEPWTARRRQLIKYQEGEWLLEQGSNLQAFPPRRTILRAST